MTTDQLTAPISGGRRARLLRFAGAFLIGSALATALAAALVFGFESRFDGRVLPGVRVGVADLSGLTEPEAAERIRAMYGWLGDGTLVVETPDTVVRLPYRDLGRAPDADALAAAALAVGRDGAPHERIVAEARTLLRGVVLPARVTLDRPILEARVQALARAAERIPVDAEVLVTEVGFMPTGGAIGRTTDPTVTIAAAMTALTAIDAGAETRVVLEALPVEPTITAAEASTAAAAAERMAVDVVLSSGDESWRIGGLTVRKWIGFATTPDGGYGVTVDREKVELNLKTIARRMQREPEEATFLFKSGSVVSVDPAVEGRRLDLAGTTEAVVAGILARGGVGAGAPPITPAVVTIPPKLSTADAELVAPRMRRISSWTTRYYLTERTGFGVNVEIPTRTIDGTVVPAGTTFDFWSVVGDPTIAAGYRPGGAIIDGRSEPTGALAGGICSCSTTLFNAALRAGFPMGPRMNHYYYIDRYPLGLDATVWISSGGSRQSMSWTNDTEYPVLIRGKIRREGGYGYVTFELWSVPTGRTVQLSNPTVKNIRSATLRYEDTATLPWGTREQIEWPTDGKDVWVTRTVRDASGAVIRTDLYYSHYARVDGIILVGTAGGPPAPKPTPTPTPVPQPTPTPSP